MPNVVPTKEVLQGGTHRYTWANLTSADSQGDPVRHPGSADRTVQIIGAFGTGTLLVEGSLDDGNNYATLSDPQGNALSKTQESIEGILENALDIRPTVTGADGTTDLTVVLTVRSTMR